MKQAKAKIKDILNVVSITPFESEGILMLSSMRRRTFCTIALTLLSALFVTTPTLAQDKEEIVPGEVLVGVRTGSSSLRFSAQDVQVTDITRGVRDLMTFDARDIGTPIGTVDALGVVQLKLRPNVTVAQAIQFLRQRPDVLYVEPNRVRRAFTPPNDTSYATAQYGPQKMQADKAWDIWSPKATVNIAIVDTGVDYNHPDIAGKLLKNASGAVVGYNVITKVASGQDDHWHGTHCAGIAAASINNNLGIAGIAGWNPTIANSNDFVRVMPVKVLDSTGSGSDLTVANGITWAADNGAHVISMSLGGTGSSTTLANAVTYAQNKNVVVVAASGNSGNSVLTYPGAYDGVISVGATDNTDKTTSWSNYGTWVKVVAPGNNIYSLYLGVDSSGQPNYAYASGTSMACPHVAGEAALIRAQNPALTAKQVGDLITSNVDPYTPYASGREIAAGAGRANAYKALLSANGGQVALASVVVTPTTVTGGSSATGTVALTGVAPAGGVSVSLSSNSTAAAVPATVTIAQGQTQATFTATSNVVASSTPVTLTATLAGATKTATLTLTPPALTAIAINPNSVVGGVSSTGTVTIGANAPTGGMTLALSYSSKTGLNAPPASILIPAGQKTATFTLGTVSVATNSVLTVTATLNGVIKIATFTVKAPTLNTISLSSSSVVSEAIPTGTVSLTSAAPAGGIVVTLASGNTNAATVPATVTIPANATSVTFPITTKIVSAMTSFTISASYGGVTKTTTLTVRPPEISVLSLSPATLVGGGNVTGTVTLTGNTIVATTVNIANTNTSATAPATVTVPAGAKTVTFTITTVATSATKTGNVTATTGSVSKSVVLTVNP